MDWNGYWSVNTVTPFLFESSGDSEEVKSNIHHQEHDELVMDKSEGLSFRLDVDVEDDDDDDDDDDAQSCSYDHSSYIYTRYGSYDDSQHDQSQRLTYDDHEESNIDYDDEEDDDSDKNQSESKLRDSSKKQKISHKYCVDLLNQKEIDRKFWEACLAS